MHSLVVHCMKSKFDVYCGRWHPKQPNKSKWHNPFSDGTREENISRFVDYLSRNTELLNCIHELRGKVLGCWCAPKDCHCDILARVANDEP